MSRLNCLKIGFHFAPQLLHFHNLPSPAIWLSNSLLIFILGGSITNCTSQGTFENQKVYSSSTLDSSGKCRTLAKTTVSAAKPSISVSYSEPTTRADGSPLTNLAKTTIYYDLGNGLVKAKDILATNPTGGGKVSETLQVPLKPGERITATICVTATDVEGREG